METTDKVLGGFLEDNGDAVDWTGEFNVYSKGKTTQCECGQGIGVKHDESVVKCASCNRLLVDTEYNERAEQANGEADGLGNGGEVGTEEQEQTKLGEW